MKITKRQLRRIIREQMEAEYTPSDVDIKARLEDAAYMVPYFENSIETWQGRAEEEASYGESTAGSEKNIKDLQDIWNLADAEIKAKNPHGSKELQDKIKNLDRSATEDIPTEVWLWALNEWD